MSTDKNLSAPPAVLAAVEKVETLDARRIDIADRLRAAKLSVKKAQTKDAEEGAEAELAGKPLKSSRKHEEAAEASVAELTSRLRAVEAAYKVARAEAYRATAKGRAEWLANVEPADAKARADLEAALASAKSAIATLAQTNGVRGFLAAFVPDPGASRPQEMARQSMAQFGAYWPNAGRLGFPNRVTIQHNAAPTPLELLEIVARVLEEPKPPLAVLPATQFEASMEKA